MKLSISGKGGTGKSVTVSLLARAYEESSYSVLVVDADESNPGLYRNFGLRSTPRAIIDMFGGDKRLSSAVSQGIEVAIADPSVETAPDGSIKLSDLRGDYVIRKGEVTFASVGKITAAFQGCACPMAQALKVFLEKLRLGEREVALIDMEAGVEHFGRGVESAIDGVIVVVEPSFESMALAAKINYMARSAGMQRVWALLNKIPSPAIEARLREELTARDIPVIGAIRYEPLIFETSLSGEPLGESMALDDARGIVRDLLVNAGAA
jgi:CO dehydrogenase maturation factor